MPYRGIGDWDLQSPDDHGFALNSGSGPLGLDQLVFYRAGQQLIAVLGGADENFAATYKDYGIGGYDLKDPADRAFAYDYDISGRQDHIVLYRPGHKTLFIVGQDGAGGFKSVFQSVNGIAGYDLLDPGDRAFALDFTSNGNLSHLVLYRPGDGAFYVISNSQGNFAALIQSHNGVAGYDLKDPGDRAFAYDYYSTGNLDHVVLYRPGHGVLYVAGKGIGDTLDQRFASQSGVGPYDLLDPNDQAFAYDYNGSGKLDHIVLYRPGHGVLYVLGPASTSFAAVYATSTGVAGFDMLDPSDQAFAFDYDGSGKQDHIVLYRPGTGRAAIVKPDGSGNFLSVFDSPYGIWVPNLVGLALDAAESVIHNSQFTVGTITPTSNYKPNQLQVTSQNPEAGDFASPASNIDLDCVPVMTTVPNVLGITGTDASTSIENHRLIPDRHGDDRDLVATQTPAPNTQIVINTVVDYTTRPKTGTGLIYLTHSSQTANCTGKTNDPLFSATEHAIITGVTNQLSVPIQLTTFILGVARNANIGPGASTTVFNGINYAQDWTGTDNTIRTTDLGPIRIDWQSTHAPL